MTEPSPDANPAPDKSFVASKGHTAGFLLILLALSHFNAASHTFRPDATAEITHRARLILYGVTLAASWALFLYVRRGIRRAGRTVAELIEPAPKPGILRWLKHTGVGLLTLFQWLILAVILHRLFRGSPAEAQALNRLLPHGLTEGIFWVALSLTAGFCEEFEFRGYLQRQFKAWTGNAAGAILLQAIVFGLGHAYQSPRQMFFIAVLGVLVGVVAEWRKSLVPGMFFHGALDLLDGLLWQFVRR